MTEKSNDEIAAQLLSGIRQSSGYTDSRLAKERERVIKFYQGDLPDKTTGSNNGYVSMDVHDAVENMKATLMDAFTGKGRPAKFPAMHAADVEAAHIATEYVSNVIFEQNTGFRIIHDVIDDALLCRNGIVKVWWDEKVEDQAYDMSSGALPDLHAFLAQHPDADIHKLELSDDGVTIERAEITVKEDKSQVRIEALPLEEFGISALAKSIEDAKLVYHRQMKTASELIKEGYDKKLVQSLQDQDESWLSTQPELLLRFEKTDDIVSMRENDDNGPAKRVLLVYECYTEIDMENTGVADLWKIVMVGDTILHKERVNHKPFVSFCPLPRPHAFWGTNYAKLVIPTQVARSYLTRSVVDHSLITNNPRYAVVRGAVLNPRELMENRIGGIVNVARPDGIQPLPQSGLNPFVFQTIQMLDQNKQELTGISSLATGLNTDAISKQNSADMVNQLITVSQVRQCIIARQFAEGFLADLYRLVYQLVCENENREKIIRVAGNWTPINPSDWPERQNLEVEFALGYGEQEKEAQKWTQIDQYLAGDPRLAPFYPADKRFNVLTKALTHMGVKDVNTYILTPAQVKPPPPDPMHQAQLATQQADAAVKNASAQAALAKIQLEQQVAALNHKVEMAKLELEQVKLQAHIASERDKLAHQVSVDAVEMQLQKEAQAQGKVTSIVEPK